MVAEEVKVIFKAEGAERFARENLNAERALRAQQRAINEQVRSIRAEIDALRATEAPNQARIRMLQRQAAELARSRQALNDQARALRDNANAAKQANSGATVLAGSFSKLNVILGALGVTVSAVGIVKMAEDFNQLQGKVRNSLDDVAEFDSVMKKLIESSNRSGAALDGVVQAFVRLRPAAANLGVTNDELIRFNETFSKMGALAGATSEEIKNSMIQLSQGIAAGALRGDELRSVMEQMPQVARTIAKSMGIPFEQFKKAAEEGKITADQVFKAIMAEAEATDAAFAKLPASIGRSFTVLTNSATVFVGALNDILDITGTVSRALKGLADILDTLTGFLKQNSDGLREFWQETIHLIGAIIDLVSQISPLLVGLRDLYDQFQAITGLNFNVELTNIAQGLDFVASSAEKAANEVGRFRDTMLSSGTGGDIKKIFDQYDARNAAVDTAYRERTIGRYLNLIQPKGKPNASGGGGNIRSITDASGKKKKTRTAKPETVERQAVADVMDDLGDQQRAIDSKLRLTLAGLSNNEDDIALYERMKALRQETQKLQLAEKALAALAPKTKEGQKAKAEAFEKLNDAITNNQADILVLARETEKYFADLKFADFGRDVEEAQAKSEFARDQTMKGEEEQAQNERELYEQRKISIDAYYEQVQTHIRNKLAAEQKAHDETIDLIQKEIDKRKELYQETEDAPAIKDLRLKLKLKNLKFEGLAADLRSDKDKAEADRKKALQQAANDFGDALSSNIASAIEEAFSDQGPLQAIQNFGKNLKTSIVKFLADALVEGFRNSKAYAAITTWFGDLFNKISGRSGAGSPTSSGTGGLSAGVGKLGGKATTALAGIGAALGIFDAFQTARNAEGIGRKNAAIGGGVGLAAGAGIGAALGSVVPGIGTIAGALAGAGMGASLGSKAGKGMDKHQMTGALIGMMWGLPGALVGWWLGGSQKRKQKARAQYQQTKLQPFLDSVVANAQSNANDLGALQANFLQAARGMQGRGSNGMAMKRAAMTQILELIKQREEAIKQAMVELDSEKSQLEYEIATFGQSDLEKAAATYKFNLTELQRDTQALLDQFKDSEEAKTKILANESLKRQLLEKQAQDAYKQSAQELSDLFAQRDEISNQNVFQRRKTAEQTKAEDIAAIDKQIAEALKSVGSLSELGFAAPNVPGINRLLDASRQAMGSPQIDILINGATDPNAVGEEVRRQMEAFFRKYYGAVA